MKESGTKSRLRPRRIIERPRLTRLLDNSTARVRMLIAPAGYGKTTLAEQWTSAPGRTAVWYQCRRASADVAHLAIGLAEAAAVLLPGCDTRLRERLLATKDPSAEVETLAAILAEDLEPWPSEAWLVIDDYHLLTRSSEAEELVEILVRASSVNVCITSRERPAWWSTRLALYGTLFELDQAELAMSGTETGLVLDGSDPKASVLNLAHGWPAVISLVAVLESTVAEEAAPRKLYDFFANEIFKDLDRAAQVALARLAIAPMLDRMLAMSLLGEDSERLLKDVLASGLISERDDEFHLHPLARAFLKGPRIAGELELKPTIDACLEHYVTRGEWDAAFDLLDENQSSAGLEALLVAALDDLLRAARLATVEKWVSGTRANRDHPIFDIARGEVALRRAEYVSAQSLAERALKTTSSDASLEFRALKLAGQAAHSANREAVALAFFQRAQLAATDEWQVREAQFCQLMCATALESEEAETLMVNLSATVVGDSPTDLVRMSGRRLMFEINFGAIESLEDARDTEQLLAHVDDPLVRCSFRSSYSTALVLDANYSEAHRVASELLSDAASCRLEFALPYGRIAQGLALAGLHSFDEAEAVLFKASEEARSFGDDFGHQSAFASRVRVLAQQGRSRDACVMEPPRLDRALPNMRGEVIGSRGLALACTGRIDEAEEAARLAAELTHGIEANALAVAIDAVIAAESGQSDAYQVAQRLVDMTFRMRAIDLLVTAYRSSRSLFGLLFSIPSTRERMVFAVRRASDDELLAAAGLSIAALVDPGSSLTPREREICNLASNGLPNREIAQLLFISEGTVKTHLHNIFEKLGVKSRRALVRGAAERRTS